MEKGEEMLLSLRLRFSNWLLIAVIALIWNILGIIILAFIASTPVNRLAEIGEKVGVAYFLEVIIFSFVFIDISWTAISIFTHSIRGYLVGLETLFSQRQNNNQSSNNDVEAERQRSNLEKLALAFKNDLDRWGWLSYAIIIGIPATIVHYFGWGYRIKESLGLEGYLAVWLFTVFPVILVGAWLFWLLFAQYLHLYKFTKRTKISEVELYMGLNLTDTLENEKSLLQKALARASRLGFVPARTNPQQIAVDIFNVDNLGGLSPLANMSLFGTVLMGIVFAVSVPLIYLANKALALLILPVFLLGIVGSYVIGISSLREAIQTEKRKQLMRINRKLATIAEEIIVAKTEEEEERVPELMQRFRVYDEIGKKISNVPETPRTLSATVKIITSGSLPIISFGTIQQANLLQLLSL